MIEYNVLIFFGDVAKKVQFVCVRKKHFLIHSVPVSNEALINTQCGILIMTRRNLEIHGNPKFTNKLLSKFSISMDF